MKRVRALVRSKITSYETRTGSGTRTPPRASPPAPTSQTGPTETPVRGHSTTGSTPRRPQPVPWVPWVPYYDGSTDGSKGGSKDGSKGGSPLPAHPYSLDRLRYLCRRCCSCSQCCQCCWCCWCFPPRSAASPPLAVSERRVARCPAAPPPPCEGE